MSGVSRRFPAHDRDATAAGTVNDLAWGGLEWAPRALPGLAVRRRGRQSRAPAQASQAGHQLKVVPRSGARPTRPLVAAADRGPADL